MLNQHEMPMIVVAGMVWVDSSIEDDRVRVKQWNYAPLSVGACLFPGKQSLGYGMWSCRAPPSPNSRCRVFGLCILMLFHHRARNGIFLHIPEGSSFSCACAREERKDALTSVEVHEPHTTPHHSSTSKILFSHSTNVSYSEQPQVQR